MPPVLEDNEINPSPEEVNAAYINSLEQQYRQQEELEYRQQQDRRQNLPGAVGNAAKEELAQAGKQLAGKAIKQAATKAAASTAWSGLVAGAAAAWPVISVILVVIGIILLILLVIFLTLYQICNPESWLASVTTYLGELSGVLPKEICDSFNSSFGGIGQAIQSAVSAACSMPDGKGGYITGINCPAK